MKRVCYRRGFSFAHNSTSVRYCSDFLDRESTNITVSPKTDAKSREVEPHISNLGVTEGSQKITLSDVKIAFFLRCRKIHPLCGGKPEEYEQLKKSYAIVAAHVSGGHVLDFNPGETATDMFYNTREVHELKQFWGSTLVFILLTLFILFHLGLNIITYQKQAEALGKYRNHIAADTLKPWWGSEVQYEKNAKRLFLEEWNRAKSSAQQQKVAHIGTVSAASGGSGMDVIHPSKDYISQLRNKIDRQKAL